LLDWLDLRNMLLVARSVAAPAIARNESRGAHQREDHPGLDEGWAINQIVSLRDGALALERATPLKKDAPSTGAAS
jgi:succinate dehydrogenase / fumarate reductase flavoprotein subunit